MFILAIGGGKVGYYLVKHLVSEGQEVTIIEKDKDKCGRINEELGSICFQGDGCDPGILQEAGVERADIVAAVTGDDEDNLIICQVAKTKFNAPFTLARVNNPKNEDVFKKLGIDATVSSTNIILSMIEQEVAYKGIMTSLALKKGGVEIVETMITPNSPSNGKSLKDLNIPSQCIIAGIIRGDEFIIPNGNSQLVSGDLVITLAKEDKFPALREVLAGKK